MKKIVILFIIFVLFLSGCRENMGIPGVSNNENSSNISNTYKEESSSMSKVDFIEIPLASIDWNQIEFPINPEEIKLPIDVKSIVTKEDAIKVGETIIEDFWKINRFSTYELLSIVHSTQDNIWLFDYSINQRDKDVDDLIECGGFYVAIHGDNCEIIKAWVDE